MEPVAYTATIAFGMFMLWIGYKSEEEANLHRDSSPSAHCFFARLATIGWISGGVLTGLALGMGAGALINHFR